jgi:hypothetical protein
MICPRYDFPKMVQQVVELGHNRRQDEPVVPDLPSVKTPSIVFTMDSIVVRQRTPTDHYREAAVS